MEFLVLENRELDAARFSNPSRLTALDAGCGGRDFHSRLRKERNTHVLHSVELLDHFHDRVKVVVLRMDESWCDDDQDDCDKGSHRRPHFSSFFVFGFAGSISRSGMPNCPSSFASFWRSTGPTIFTTVSSLPSLWSTASPPIVSPFSNR